MLVPYPSPLEGRGKVRVIKEGFQGFSRGRIPLEYLVGKTR
jgi:hypothetical protein